MSEDQYQEELAKLMVQDDSGVFWSLEPGTGRWLYFNGTEWVPGMPPPPSAPPPVMPPPVIEQQPGSYQPYAAQTPSYQEPAPQPVEPAPQETSYYVPSDVTRPLYEQGTYDQTTYNPASYNQGGYQQGGYDQGQYDQGGYNQGAYPGTPGYQDNTAGSSYVPLPDQGQPADADSMPTYVRMPEPDPAAGAGGIPPRPVRDASPLSVPGGERAWLPFAFGALVLLCAVVLFFGVRGLPQFSGASPAADPTEEPTEEVQDVLPTRTSIIEPTAMPQPTDAPTEPPAPTPAPQPVTAAATDVLNIRQGPDRTTPSLGKLQPNQTVTVVGRNGDGTWLYIVRPDGGGNGWVSAEFTTITGDINSLPVTTGDGGAAPQPTETPTG